jgi:hypothetical protein
VHLVDPAATRLGFGSKENSDSDYFAADAAKLLAFDVEGAVFLGLKAYERYLQILMMQAKKGPLSRVL